jgi:hypothetical protein
VRGKFLLDSLVGGLHYLYEEWNLLGDPELPLWTARPAALTVEFDPVIRPDSQQFSVRATCGMLPVGGALVCAMMDSTVYATAVTDGQGQAVLDICPVADGELAVTVTGRNCLPFEGTVQVVSAPLRLDSLALCDSPPGGNGDGIAGPGETCSLTAFLANVTDSLVPGVRAALRNTDADVAVSESLASFGDIGAQGRAGNEAEPFVFTVVPEPADTLAEFVLHVWYGADSADLRFSLPLAPLVGATEAGPARCPAVAVRPNPARFGVGIRFTPAAGSRVRVRVRDNAGRVVRTLMARGAQSVRWDGTDQSGRSLPAGVYFIELDAAGRSTTRRLLLTR